VNEVARLGRGHRLIRELRVLRRDADARERAGLIVAEGLHLTEEALRSGATIRQVVASPRLGRSAAGARLRSRLAAAGVPVAETSDRILETLQDARSPQPVLALIERPRADWEALWRHREGPPLVVLADGCQDPGNLGSILRSADAGGAAGLVVCGSGCDPFHPRAVRGTMGSIFRLPMVRAPLDEALAVLRARGLTRVGSVPAGGAPPEAVDFTGPVAIVLGAEAAGLEPGVVRGLDASVSVPMSEGVESLSVGAAAAVLIFEAARQRRAAGSGLTSLRPSGE